ASTLSQAPTQPPRLFCCFFFQAEDGIRYRTVTGVQTCALPILHFAHCTGAERGRDAIRPQLAANERLGGHFRPAGRGNGGSRFRSEERRVGKECRSRGIPHQERKSRTR